MKTFTPVRRGLLATVVLGALAPSAGAATPPSDTQAGVTPAWGCPDTERPVLDPTSPRFLAGDLGAYTSSSQTTVNCFAWQTFVALQWPVDSRWPQDPDRAGEPDRQFQAAGWGVPVDPRSDDSRPRVWETFKPAQAIFLPGGETPSAWGVLPDPSAACRGGAATASGRRLDSHAKLPGAATLARLDAAVLNPDETDEVVGGWLTDQAGELVWYERLVSRAEFAYIVDDDNRLYRSARQAAVANNTDGQHPQGLSLPAGQAPGDEVQPWQQRGAMEIKAAWRNLDDHPELWPRYRVAQAWLTDPETGECEQAVMGLVGFHFILKSEHFPNFLWATFEHIDNVPTPGAGYAHPHGYSFHDPQCEAAEPARDCTPNQPRVKCDQSGHCTPQYPESEPVQVTRQYPIPTSDTAPTLQLNLAMQEMIAEATGGRSVFQYYQLVNTLWAQSPVPPYTEPGGTVPLKVTSLTSGGNQPVANATLETYVQDKTCTECHAGATIAPGKGLASDFSFLFSLAEDD
ncbi:hypothetical protein [Halomonas ramblicola]|uniref:hypothetical protein n=1 Tax=Halomonas ramblicola TaxID=747349 RepID=UPI0025B622EB|nr:hypothetical protein [Halomonas ramblicola]MDN3523572.1 hypothetical protein [Halomonas ramblicola]